MSVISHITFGTNDPERSARFYDEVLGLLGFNRLPKPPGKPPAYEKGGMPTVYIYIPEDGRPATWGNGTHVAFVADTKQSVRDFHAAAIRLGGSTEGEPGPRPQYGENYYAAYVRDPDGNKLQAVCYASNE
ncbi:MAG: VOC family protein [Pseudomonadota bacterium]